MTQSVDNSNAAQSGTESGGSWWADLETLTRETHLHLARSTAFGDLPGDEIRERIARGGQGAVDAAVESATRTPVAIKVLLNRHFGSAATRRRFLREIEIAAVLDHPHIVRVLQSGTTATGLPYFVMPRINGLPFDAWAANQRRAGVPAIVALCAQLCETVHFAHERGVIHRD